MISRRTFLKSAGLLSAGALIAGSTASSEQTSDFELVETQITIPELPAAFEDYRVAFISDIHLGPWFPIDWLSTTLSMIENAKPDLLLLGGDYIWIPDSTLSGLFLGTREPRFDKYSGKAMASPIFQSFADQLSTINIPDGVCAVFGNHDRWEGPTECRKLFSGAGVAFLVNDTHTVQRGTDSLVVYGMDDYWTGFPDYAPALPAAKDGVRVLLTHNPDSAAIAQKISPDKFDLAVCGHTHGGQICLPLIGPLVTNVRAKNYHRGLIDIQAFPTYVSRGLGVVEVPFRINCRPEVTILNVIRA